MSPKQSQALKAKAAALVAADEMTNLEISVEVGVSLRTINYWKADPQFNAEVGRLSQEGLDKRKKEARTTGIADLDWTIDSLKRRHAKLQLVIEKRAKDPEMAEAPGGTTGLLCVTYKMQSIGEGLGSSKVPEYAVDTGLLQEMREIEVQLQTHLGTWKEKVEKGGTVNINIIMERLHAGRQRVADAPEPANP